MRGHGLRREVPRTSVETACDDLVDECEAFLAGRWAELRRQQGRVVSPWAWLNQAAHADVETLQASAVRPACALPSTSDDLEPLLARALLSVGTPDDVARVQREVLVPLELHVMGIIVSPRRLVELVTTALFD
jgi:hypothetical protein